MSPLVSLLFIVNLINASILPPVQSHLLQLDDPSSPGLLTSGNGIGGQQNQNQTETPAGTNSSGIAEVTLHRRDTTSTTEPETTTAPDAPLGFVKLDGEAEVTPTSPYEEYQLGDSETTSGRSRENHRRSKHHGHGHGK